MPRANRAARGGKRPGSGRPPGRKNNVPREVSFLARDFGPEALEILIAIARDEKQPAASRIASCGMILDRGYGQAPAAIDLAIKYDPESLSDAELTAIIRQEQANERAHRARTNGRRNPDGRDLH